MANTRKVQTYQVHLKQPVYKKIQKLALERAYKEDAKQTGSDTVAFLLDFYEQNKIEQEVK